MDKGGLDGGSFLLLKMDQRPGTNICPFAGKLDYSAEISRIEGTFFGWSNSV